MLLFSACQAARAEESLTRASDWPSYYGSNQGSSYSALKQINRQNVGTLLPAWVFSTGLAKEGLSATPLVIDGTMFFPTADNSVFALQAATGRLLWRYLYQPSESRSGPRKPLGLAAGFGLVFIGTADHHLIALDQTSGRERWDVEISDPRQCGCGPSVAPLLVKDKIVIGVSSFDTAHRGYIDAFYAKTGKHAWRFWAIPGPGEAGHDTWPNDLWKLGTSSTWLTGSFDAPLNLIYWPVGNPGPMIGGDYSGRKLYSDSVLALDADTGKLKWYFQEIPNDKFDYDALEPILFNANIDGHDRRLLLQPNKGGFAYVLDRVSGAFIRGFRFAEAINWTQGLDAAGQPLDPRLSIGQSIDTLACPGVYVARAIGHSSYSPLTHWWYNSSYETCTHQMGVPPRAPQEGFLFTASIYSDTRIAANSHPLIAAFDPVTAERKWIYPSNSVNLSSLVSTAGNLLFGGDVFGNVFALDAIDGTKLWSFDIGTGISSTPISFAVGGRQYIAVAGGLSPVAAALVNDVLTNEEKALLPPVGSVIVAFALPETARSAAP